MDKEFNITARWRNKRLHRKCLFCSYVKMLPSTRCSPDTWICQCKDKVVNPDTIRPFCKCFKVNIKECENFGYNSNCVDECCKGITESYKDLGWTYIKNKR